jgi:hypothetical protein
LPSGTVATAADNSKDHCYLVAMLIVVFSSSSSAAKVGGDSNNPGCTCLHGDYLSYVR